jgi:cystathionine beta-synthase
LADVMQGRPAIAPDILALIGRTPLVRLSRVARDEPFELLAKLEFLNPGGSVKDRIGPSMVDRAEREGLLRPGGTLVEATSGNTGVGLALCAAVRGYQLVVVLPDKMSSEKIRLLRALGARVVVTPSRVAPEDPRSNYSVARRLAQEIPGAYYPNQYENEANPQAHFETTGPEILEALDGRVDAVVASIGTGGTVSGIGRFFKARSPSTRVVAVDPEGSILAPFARTGQRVAAVPYKVEGIGEDLIPRTVDFSVIDEFVTVQDGESFRMARRLAREEGIFAGGSSGAAVLGALRWAHGAGLSSGARVVVILPDSGDRYLSTFYSDEWMRENGFLEETVTAREILGAKRFTPPLVAAEPAQPVREVLRLLQGHGVAQVPVLESGQNVGSALEEDLLRRVLADGSVLDRSVRGYLAPPFPEVAPSTPLSEVFRRLREDRALLVREGSGYVGLITRHDLLSFLGRKEENLAL